MTNFERLHKSWILKADTMNESPWMQRLSRGDLGIEHYKGYLLETYHHAGRNPQIQAYCTMFFKDNPRETIGKFFKHAISEISHDLLAANDLKSLGVDEDLIFSSKPLASTIALNAFALYQIQFVNPISYLGYLFHLEFLPTRSGQNYISALKKLGVPDSALTFLKEHSTVDISHNILMKQYIDALIKTPKDLEDVIYSAEATCSLHLRMIEGALINGEAIFSRKKDEKTSSQFSSVKKSKSV